MNANWSTCKLSDIADVRVSNVDKKTSSAETPVKLCNYMDVYANDYVTKSIDFMVASASKSEIDRFRLQAGDVIITKDSETPDDIGVPAVVTDSIDGLVCGYHLALIRPRSDVIDSIYLAKQLSTAPISRYFSSNASGSTRFGLPINVIEDARIPVAPKPEQTKIAQILSTVDRAIEQTEALIAKQQRIKTGLMQDLLTRGIDEHGKLRSEQTHQFKDSPLGRIPVEWKSGYFESCISGSPKNGIYKPQSAYSEQGTPIIRIDAFGHGDRINAQSQKRVLLSKSEIDQYRLREGEILINRVNSIQYLGKTALVEHLSEATVFESNMMRLTIDQRRMLPDFALLLLTGPAAFIHFLRNAKLAVAQASINQHDVISLPIQRPHLEEQRAICERIASNGGSIKNTFSGLEKLHRVKTALMHDLLTGKRRVNSYVPISSNQPSQGFE